MSHSTRGCDALDEPFGLAARADSLRTAEEARPEHAGQRPVPYHHTGSSFDSMLRRLVRVHSSQQTSSLPCSTEVTQVSGTSSPAGTGPTADVGCVDAFPQKPHTAMQRR
jgi:hypothetical protein